MYRSHISFGGSASLSNALVCGFCIRILYSIGDDINIGIGMSRLQQGVFFAYRSAVYGA